MEKVLSALIDRTKFAYVPLEYYDLDRQIAPMLPDSLTLGRLFVPFDLVSRTMMVACCNPFDADRARSGAAIGRLHSDVVSGAPFRADQKFAVHLPPGEPGLSGS